MAKTRWIPPACWSAGDGSSKQRGHGRPPKFFPVAEEVLFPSGSAALYRRAMLEQIGGFDEDFFLYCEDTDLGLRARWAGWRCLYAPEAVVEHHYSHSAGRASRLKAYYVERNRLFVLAKNFPARMLAAAPFVSLARYLVALAIPAARTRRRRPVSPGRRFRLAHALLRAAGARRAAAACAGLVAQAPPDPPHAARDAAYLPEPAALAFHFGAAGGGALTMSHITRLAAHHRAGL
jgi:GT2 family glycosyltransferase